MKKMSVALAVIVLFLLAGNPADAQVGITLGVSYESAPASTVSLPTELRSVGTNPADGSVRTRLIPDTSVTLPAAHLINYSVAPQVRFGPIALRGGFMFITPGSTTDNADRFEGVIEWGQFVNNRNRGTGTSLVFVRMKRSRLSYGPFVEAELGNPVIGAFVGYRNLHYDMVHESGWDRYDQLEVANTDKGGIETGDTYFGVTVSPFGANMRALAIRATMGSRKSNRYRMTIAEAVEDFEDSRYFTVGMAFRFGRK